METTVYSVVVVLFVCVLVRNLFVWVDILTRCDYKLSAFIAHLRTWETSRRLVFNGENILKLLLIISFFSITDFYSWIQYFPYFVLGVYLISFFSLAKDMVTKTAPAFPKNYMIVILGGITLALDLFFLQIPLFDRFFWFLFIEKISPLIFILFVIGYSVAADFYRDIEINRAIKKLSDHKTIISIVVIGNKNIDLVTHHLARILSRKFSVVVNHNNENSAIDIARLIQKRVSSLTNILIIGIQTHKKVKHDELSSLITPRIKIFTGCDDEDVVRQWNIGDKESICIANADDTHLKTILEKERKKIQWYGELRKKMNKTNAEVQFVRNGKTTTTCRFFIGQKNRGTYRIPLIGKENILSILPGLLVAKQLPFKNPELKYLLDHITPVDERLQIFQTSNNSFFIQDTKSDNFSSYVDAIETCERFKQKKYLILTPFSDGEKNKKKKYYQLGFLIGTIFDTVYLTSKDYYSVLKRGITDSNGKCKIVIATEKNVSFLFAKRIHKEDVVLFEGEKTNHYFAMIESESVY